MNGTKFVNGQQVKAKKVVEKKEPKAKAKVNPKPIEKRERGETVNSVTLSMLLERKHTDSEIEVALEKKFPGKRFWVACYRCDINTGRQLKARHDEFKKNPIIRLMRDPSGKLVPWQPKAKTVKAKIAGTAADPLVKAGVIKKEKSTTPTKS